MWAWLVMACGGQPAWEDCPDAACRQAGLLEAWEASPETVLGVVPGLDAVEQAVLIDDLATRAPASSERLCAAVPKDGPAGLRCLKIKKRPHLAWGDRVKPVETHERRAAGPGDSHLRTTPAELPEVTADCPTEAGEDRNDCWFQAAEALARAEGTARFGEVLALCRGSGPFERPCLEHVVALSLPPVPPADQVTQGDLDAAVRAIDTIARTVGPLVAKDYVDKAWARWTSQAYARASRPTGGLGRLLPKEAAPHVNMALATRVVSGRSDLARWMTDLRALQQRQYPLKRGESVARPSQLGSTSDLWDRDREGEDSIRSAFCLGAGRRAVSEDPGQDNMIVLLEASARSTQPPPPEFYLGLVGGEQPELVRWTAARLAWGLYAGAAEGLNAGDPSPLVQSWLRPP